MDDHALSERLLTPSQAAGLLQVSRRTLEKWRAEGWGPPVLELTARSLRYREGDLLRWLNQRRRLETSAA